MALTGSIELPSLAWSADLSLLGLSSLMETRVRERWEGLTSPPAGRSSAAARISLEVVDRPVGTPLTPLVEVEVLWRSSSRATFTAASVEGELEILGDVVIFEGRADAGHARGALESAFRTVAALSLARRRVVVLHASAVASADHGLVFLGDSGAGKTTAARRLAQTGWRRLADDMIAIDLAVESRLHLLPFERAGRWPFGGATLAPPRCLAGGLVLKEAIGFVRPAMDVLRVWSRARLAVPAAPGDEEQTIRDFVDLCRIPTFDVGVPRAGSLAPLARTMLSMPSRKALDVRSPHRHPPPTVAGSNTSLDELTDFDETCCLHRSPNVAWRIIDGRAVLVAPSSPLVRTLNEVGTLVWALADGRPISRIVDEVVNEFAVSCTQAKADVEHFIADLQNKRLLTVSRGG